MLLLEISETSRAVAATAGRRAKIDLLAACLRAAGPGEVAITVAYLSGELPQRQIGVGWTSLRDRVPPAADPTLTVADVDAAFTELAAVSGKGSVAARKGLLDTLFARATTAEGDFLTRLISGELRQGALDGIMADAVAKAAGIPATEVRRAAMFRGSLAAIAPTALTQGTPALRAIGLQLNRPIKPMLAASAPDLPTALQKLTPPNPTNTTPLPAPNSTAPPEPDSATPSEPPGTTPSESRAGATPPGSDGAGSSETAGGGASVGEGSYAAVAVEWKLDGIRVQVHIDGGGVRLFTRTLDEITARLPDVVAALEGLPVSTGVFDGEVIALREDGRPHPFQVTSARTASRTDTGVPLSVFLFDVLHLDGADLIDQPSADRHAALAKVVPEPLRMPRIVTSDATEAQALFDDALAHGHEGVVVKSLDTPYTAGRRGAGWIKVKPRHTLDLVVLAVEWGSGRRRGKLSNLHLGARDPETGGFVMLGKTFKGLTDELLAWQTEHLLALEDHRDDWTIYVRPELVVEIAFDGVQRSSRYPGGLALRFARVLRYRPDKSPAEADTITTVKALHPDHELSP